MGGGLGVLGGGLGVLAGRLTYTGTKPLQPSARKRAALTPKKG
jgi:hypothetical protein